MNQEVVVVNRYAESFKALNLFLLISGFVFSGLGVHADEPETQDIIPPKGFTTLKNGAELRQVSGLEPYFKNRGEHQKKIESIKVAVLDVGFGEIEEKKIRKQLPQGSKLISKYAKGPCAQKSFPFARAPQDSDYPFHPHGMHMVQTVWGITGHSPQGPKFLLYNANGLPAFRCAVRDLIDNTKPDVVLFSANWETFGAFDGSGEVNDLVEEAVDEGIIWINAAGNYGGLVKNISYRGLDPGGNFLNLGEDQDSWYLPFENHVDDNLVKIKLAWPDKRQERDLELRLFSKKILDDRNEPPLAYSEKIIEQNADGEPKPTGAELTYRLKGREKETYYLAIKKNTGEFSKGENIRVTLLYEKMDEIDPEAWKIKKPIEFVAKEKRSREIMDPGSSVGLTIGTTSEFSAIGPTLDGRVKPEILIENSLAKFTDDLSVMGTSYSAAFFAGMVAVLKAHHPKLKQNDLLKFRMQWPEASLSQMGWQFGENKVREGLDRLHPTLHATLQREFGVNSLAVSRRDDKTDFLVLSDIKELSLFSNLPQKVQNNLEDYAIYLWLRITPTKKRIEESVPVTTWEKVRDGYWEYKWVDEEVFDGRESYVKEEARTEWRKTPLYDLYGRRLPADFVQLVYFPPVMGTRDRYRTVSKKVKDYYVEPKLVQKTTWKKEYRDVPGNSVIKLEITYYDPKQLLIESSELPSGTYVRLVPYSKTDYLAKSRRNSSGEIEPVFFKPPTPRELTGKN